MKKYQKKQKKMQASAHRRLMQEKRLVRLMHNQVLLSNFSLDKDNNNVSLTSLDFLITKNLKLNLGYLCFNSFSKSNFCNSIL